MQTYASWLLQLLLFAGGAQAAPVVQLEIATERGLQITAPQEWLQLLTSIGIQNVRIRGIEPSDTPAVKNQGTAENPRYHVVGILTSREQLLLPGGSFGRGDAKRLKDYFTRLSADGGERLTAPRTMFGLTEQELSAVLADLSQPIGFDTKGQTPQAIVERLQARFKQKFTVDAAADRVFRESKPAADELNSLSAGTGLAILLRTSGLVLRPEKPLGQPLTYKISAQNVEAASAAGPIRGNTNAKSNLPIVSNDRAGKPNDVSLKNWPAGWEIDRTPGESAPSLFEQLNAEIDGFSLAETLAAIGPRLAVPYFLDHADLRRGIDPSATQIKVARTRMSYKRLLDTVLAQARLGCELRADEAGLVFLWISR